VKVGWCIMLFTFFLLRELECACAQFHDMTVGRVTKQVVLKLSVSKNDPRAIGCTRKWGCICDRVTKQVVLKLSVSKNDPRAIGCTRKWGCICEETPDSLACPFHAAEALDEFIRKTFPDKFEDDGFPLFPDSDGNEVSAELMLNLIEELASLTGERLTNQAGRKRFGKHSWRATGAVHLGECGLEVSKISLLGRWFCAVVLHYTRLAPIEDIAKDFKRAKTRHGIDETVRTISVNQRKIKQTVDNMMTGIREEVAALQDRVDEVSKDCRPRPIVINKDTAKVHRVLTTVLDAGAEAAAFCGFKYAYCSKIFSTSIPEGTTRKMVCGSCFKGERNSLPE